MTVPPSIPRAAIAARQSEAKLEELKTAAEGFEAIFIKGLLKTMRGSAKETSFGPSSAGMSTYRDMMDDAIAQSAAKGGQLGIAKTLFDAGAATQLRQAIAQSTHSKPNHRS